MLKMVVTPEPAKRQPARPGNRPAPAAKPAPAPARAKTPVPTRTSASHNGVWKGRANLACSLIAILCCSYEGKGSLISYQAQPPSPPRTTRPGQPRTKAAGPRAGRAASPRSNLPLLTLDRFEQAMQIARLAAEHDLPDLSVRAVREALRAGPADHSGRADADDTCGGSGRARWRKMKGPPTRCRRASSPT